MTEWQKTWRIRMWYKLPRLPITYVVICYKNKMMSKYFFQNLKSTLLCLMTPFRFEKIMGTTISTTTTSTTSALSLTFFMYWFFTQCHAETKFIDQRFYYFDMFSALVVHLNPAPYVLTLTDGHFKNNIMKEIINFRQYKITNFYNEIPNFWDQRHMFC